MGKMPMNNVLEHKGYKAELCVDVEESIIFGRVMNLERDIISFHADTVEAAKAEFIQTIDEYLSECADDGVRPDMPKVSIPA